jgi:hypothetical protein
VSFTFRSVGAVATGNGALNPGAPAGKAVGDLLLLSLVGRDLNQTAPAPNGWVLVSPATPVSWNYLYARYADGTADDTPTGLLYTGTTRSQAQIAAFSGGLYTELSSIATNGVSQYLPGTQVSILYSSGLTITPANCLVIAVGVKNKTATSNGTTINALSGFTPFVAGGTVINGTDVSQWWGYQIQTSPTNIGGSLTQTLTGTTETLQYTSLLVALQSSPGFAGSPGTYGYTGSDAILSTSNSNTPYLLCAAGNYNCSLAHASSDMELTAGGTSYTYVGKSAAFPVYTFSMNFGSGSYAYQGKAATLTLGLAPDPLIADRGSYTYTGQLAQLNAGALPPFIAFETGRFSITGFGATLSFFNPGTFPNLIGLPLAMAQQALEQSGALNPVALGYFGTWPITILWQSAGPQGALMEPGIVTGQLPAPFTAITVNAPIVLTVTEAPVSVATPPSQAKFPS